MNVQIGYVYLDRQRHFKNRYSKSTNVIAVDAQEKKIKHLEYMRFLNYKHTLQETEENLRQRNLLNDVALHSDDEN